MPIDRSSFLPEISQNPDLIPRMASMVRGEVGLGSDPALERIQLESMFNRAQARGIPLSQSLQSVADNPHTGYYATDTYSRPATPQQLDYFQNNILHPVLNGSDEGTNRFGFLVTGNASGMGFAGRRAANGMYDNSGWYSGKPGAGEMFVTEKGDGSRWAQRTGQPAPSNPVTPPANIASAYADDGDSIANSPIQQAISKATSGAPMASNDNGQGMLSTVAQYGPGALFGQPQDNWSLSGGLMGLGAGLTSIMDPKGGAAMMESATKPLYMQRFSVTKDGLGNQRVFDLRRGMFTDQPGYHSGGSGSVSAPASAGVTAPAGTAPAPTATATAPTAQPQTTGSAETTGAAQPQHTFDLAPGDVPPNAPVAESAPGSVSPVAAAERVKLDQEQSSKKFAALADAAQAAQQMKAKATEMLTTLQQQPHLFTGAVGEHLNDLKGAVKGVFGDIPGLTDGAADADKYQKGAAELQGLNMRAQNVQRVAGPEIKWAERMSPGLDKTPEANVQILHDYLRQADNTLYAFERAKAYRSAPGGVLGPQYEGDVKTYFNNHPTSQYMTDAESKQALTAPGAKKTGGRPPLSSFSQ